MNTTNYMMTEHDVANLLSVAPATLRRWRWAGKGPSYVKVGHAVRYASAALDAFIALGTVTPMSAGL